VGRKHQDAWAFELFGRHSWSEVGPRAILWPTMPVLDPTSSPRHHGCPQAGEQSYNQCAHGEGCWHDRADCIPDAHSEFSRRTGIQFATVPVIEGGLWL